MNKVESVIKEIDELIESICRSCGMYIDDGKVIHVLYEAKRLLEEKK